MKSFMIVWCLLDDTKSNQTLIDVIGYKKARTAGDKFRLIAEAVKNECCLEEQIFIIKEIYPL